MCIFFGVLGLLSLFLCVLYFELELCSFIFVPSLFTFFFFFFEVGLTYNIVHISNIALDGVGNFKDDMELPSRFGIKHAGDWCISSRDMLTSNASAPGSF